MTPGTGPKRGYLVARQPTPTRAAPSSASPGAPTPYPVATASEGPAHRRARSGGWIAATLILWLATSGAIVVAAVMGVTGPSAGLVAIPALLLAIRLTIYRSARRETRFDLAGFVLFAAMVHVAGSLVRWFVFTEIYEGNGDAGLYHEYGRAFVDYYRQLQFDVDPLTSSTGTANLRRITTGIYAIVGTDQFVGYLVFTALAFIGLWWFYRAFVTAVPDGDHWRYAKLLFFWPSLVFWPSSIGKEAWMVFGLGLATLGVARLLSRHWSGLPIAVGGFALAALVRPHVAAILLLATVVAYVLRPASIARGAGLPGKIFVVAVLLLVTLLTVRQATHILGIEELNRASVEEALNRTEENTTDKTSASGSEFSPARVRTPLDLPWATITILFRPLPYEIHNAQSLVASVEGLLLLGLLISNWERLAHLPLQLRRVPYAALCLVFLVAFVWAFSTFGNFGLLARQRTQLFPYVLALTCLPIPAAQAALERRRTPMRLGARRRG